MTAAEIQALIADQKCLPCFTNSSLVDMIKVGLLSQISTAIAGSGVVCADYGGGTPTYVPATGCGVAVDTSTQQIWWYYSAAWH